MNKKNVKKWIAALRSDEFEQGKFKLRTNNTYCCLGVACEVFRRETGIGRWYNDEFQIKGGYKEEMALPRPVMDWLGVTHSEVEVGAMEDYYLSTKNDDEDWSFSQIANWLESKIK